MWSWKRKVKSTNRIILTWDRELPKLIRFICKSFKINGWKTKKIMIIKFFSHLFFIWKLENNFDMCLDKF